MKKKTIVTARRLLGIISFIMMILFLYFVFRRQNTLTVGIFYGSNWDVPGTKNYELFDKAIEKFEKEHPLIKINYIEGITSDDYSEWLYGQILKGEEPDVYLVMEEDFNKLVEAGALKELNTMMENDSDFDPDAFYSSAYEAGQKNKKQYALPFECNPTLMFVNNTLLKREHIAMPKADWDWDDFYDICCKVVKDSNQDGKLDTFGYYGYTWQHAVFSNRITPFRENVREANFTDDKMIEAISFTKKLQKTNQNYMVKSNDFDLGNVAFRPLSFSDYRTYMPYPWRIKKYSEFEWNCIPMPAGKHGGNISPMNLLMVGVSNRYDNTRLAWEFAKMLTTDPEIQELIYKKTSGASALKSVTNSEKVLEILNKDTPGNETIDLSQLDSIMKNAVVQTRFPGYEEAAEKADLMIQTLINNDDNIELEMFNLKNSFSKIFK